MKNVFCVRNWCELFVFVCVFGVCFVCCVGLSVCVCVFDVLCVRNCSVCVCFMCIYVRFGVCSLSMFWMFIGVSFMRVFWCVVVCVRNC